MSSIIALWAQIENITAPIHSPQTQRMVFISNLSLLSGWGSARPARVYMCVCAWMYVCDSKGETEGEIVCFCLHECVFIKSSLLMLRI